mmetsp:Transcript_38876/g.87272  ORF Transcript_38876/g.87272 Transcript_38876/m.87272 type:complete len:215 (+) Transcript_38876:339-983(+)
MVTFCDGFVRSVQHDGRHLLRCQLPSHRLHQQYAGHFGVLRLLGHRHAVPQRVLSDEHRVGRPLRRRSGCALYRGLQPGALAGGVHREFRPAGSVHHALGGAGGSYVLVYGHVLLVLCGVSAAGDQAVDPPFYLQRRVPGLAGPLHIYCAGGVAALPVLRPPQRGEQPHRLLSGGLREWRPQGVRGGRGAGYPHLWVWFFFRVHVRHHSRSGAL